MNIKKIEYNREVESVGDSVVFFKAGLKNRHWENINHFMYGDITNKLLRGTKIPLDIAIYSLNSSIEYISFFVGGEKLPTDSIRNNIVYTNDSIFITDERFTFDKRYIDIKMEFDQYLNNRDVFVISKSARIDLIGYRIDNDHYILFDKEDNFSGVVFKNLTDNEMNELKQANVI